MSRKMEIAKLAREIKTIKASLNKQSANTPDKKSSFQIFGFNESTNKKTKPYGYYSYKQVTQNALKINKKMNDLSYDSNPKEEAKAFKSLSGSFGFPYPEYSFAIVDMETGEEFVYSWEGRWFHPIK